MNIYPIVHIPDKIELLKEEMPPQPQKPLEPKPPLNPYIPSAPKLEIPKEPVLPSSDLGCFWYLLLGGVILIIFFSQMEEPEGLGPLLVISMIAVIIGIYGLIHGMSSKNEAEAIYYKQKNSYPKLVKEAHEKYNIEILRFSKEKEKVEKEYEERLKIYKDYECNIYLLKLKLYNEQINKLNSQENIQKYRSEELKKFFKTITKPSVHPVKSEIKKGVSEDNFFGFLKEKFGNKVFQHYTLLSSINSRPYVPDFTIFDDEIGYCVDIEIDEPYIGKNGKPIHYQDNEHDENRDTFFKMHGWVVIRFAEEQIIKYPKECCDVIAKLINNIFLNLTNFEYSLNASIPPIRRWTKDEAHELAFKRSRNTYLNIDLIEQINDEEHENIDSAFELPKSNTLTLESNAERTRRRLLGAIKTNEFINDNDDDLPF